jgi:DNA-binding CsgD family transcriptional regulator
MFLFNSGAEDVLLGLISTLVGSLAVAILSMADRQLSITVYQRALVVIAVVACVLVPFIEHTGQIICSCVVMAAWAMFVAVNYSFLVKKCVVAHEAPLFRQAPLRLMVPTLGFAVGWAIATFVTFQFGAHSEAFMYMRLGVAILLVVTVMVFIPVKEHHAVDGSSPSGERVTTTVVTVDRSESDLFEARCAAVSKLYQLSPRESEILVFLAKGRNAAYIQETLFISPHTVKSHIYNIYRKLDIHSQQKLMDFVEEFPLDE